MPKCSTSRLLVLVFALISSLALSQEIEIERYQLNMNLRDSFLIYQDHQANLTIKDVVKLSETKWSRKPIPALGNEGSLWLKARVKNQLTSPMTLFFTIPTPNIHIVHYFVFNDEQPERMIKTGEKYPFRNRDVYAPRYSFRLELDEHQEKTVFFQITSPGLKNIFFYLRDIDTFEETHFKEIAIKSLIFGILSSFPLIYLLLAIYLKSRKYFYYSAWIGISIFIYLRLESFFLFEISRGFFWWHQWNLLFYCLIADIVILLYWGEHPYFANNRKSVLRKTLISLCLMITILIPMTAIYHQPELNALALLILSIIVLVMSLVLWLHYHNQKQIDFTYFAVWISITLILISLSTLRFTDFRESWLMGSILFQVFLSEVFILLVNLKQLFHSRHMGTEFRKAQISPKNVVAHTISQIADQTSQPPEDNERVPVEFSEKERTEMIQSEKLASLGTLTNGLVHELNNPLAIISGHQYRLMTLTRKIETGSDEIQKSLNKIDQAVKRVMSVIDALKVYSQDDRSSSEFSSINIRETVQYTLDLCRERLKSLGVTLTTQPIPDTLIEGHQGQIMQVLLALIENAIDALIDYDKEKMISIDYRQSVTMVEIYVIDSGPGIPQHLHSKIFDPFFTGKSDDRHRGLGLSVASGIVAKHDGRLFLDHDFPSTRFVLQLRR